MKEANSLFFSTIRSSAWTPALLAAALWGVLPVLTRLAWMEKSQVASSFQLIFLFLLIRFSFSSVLTRLLLKVFRPGVSAGPSLIRGLRSGAISAKLLSLWIGITLLNNWIITLALSEIPAGIYTLVFSVHPILGVLLSAPRTAGKYVRKNWLALGITLIGTLVFCATEDFSGGAPSWIGWVSLASGMLTWLGYSLLSERLSAKGIAPLELTELTQWMGVLSALGVLFQCPDILAFIRSEPKIVSSALLTGVLGIVAFGCFQVALARSARIAFLAQYFEPIAAFLTAGFLLGEKVSAIQWLAASLTLYGLYRLMGESEDTKKSQNPEEASLSSLEVQSLSVDSLPT